MEWPADKVVRRPLAELVPYARNARTHSNEQVEQIAASIREWGWTIPVLIDESGTIIAGHGRVLAAQRLGIDEVPCMVARGWTEAQRRAYVIADNRIALGADWDEGLLRDELEAIASMDFDVGLLAFDEEELAAIAAGEAFPGDEMPDFSGDNAPDEAGEKPGLSENYSRKIEAPIYTPKGDKPSEDELRDRSKTDQLLSEIDKHDLPDEVRAFLRDAAERHTVFRFDRIAEYYCHAPPEVQDLMERSALVIIDYGKAIEGGFVDLARGMMEQAEKSKADNYA